LILDSYSSYTIPEFDLFCSENNIITECLLLYISYILQPLDVACFGLLKTAYRHLVQDLTRRSIFYIDKADFLGMYQQARTAIYSEQNILSRFRTRGLIL
jgi:hypothetical protein